jgi:phosphopantothenoylcysteine decarboxylase/phosphopantothenate--cysteine ligase
MNIVVGVTGGIAAYKATDVVSVLSNEGHAVKVVMTENAKRFITPLTLATLSKNPVYDDASEWTPDGVIKHIELARWLDVLAIVPATANTLIKLAQGMADNLLTSIYLALPKDKNVVLVPAMNTNMWDSPRVQGALEHLHPEWVFRGILCPPIEYSRARVFLVPPIEGKLACGDTGMGKIAPTRVIIEAITGDGTTPLGRII